jgi:hypothetical protein
MVKVTLQMGQNGSYYVRKGETMTKVTIELMETDYQQLVNAAEKLGKSVQTLVHEWITQLPDAGEPFDITQDPVFQMEGYDSDAPADLSTNLDTYLYGDRYPK